MGRQVIVQPNGKFALFSSVVDSFVMVNAEFEDLVQYEVDSHKASIQIGLEHAVKDLQDGKQAYRQFTMNWDEAIEQIRNTHCENSSVLNQQERFIEIAYKKDVIEIGQQVILLQEETANPYGKSKKDQLVTVKAIEDGNCLFDVCTNSEWYNKGEGEVSISVEAFQDETRFLVLKNTRIDGLDFTAEIPKEDGFYWFYGQRSKNGKVKLCNVEVKTYSNGTQYWYGSGMYFESNLKMTGLWAKAYRPNVPAVNEE